MPVEILNFSNYHIHSKITSGGNGSDWCLTDFYGISEISKRCGSWELLNRIKNIAGGNWCVIGDFNEITTQDKKRVED